MLSEPTPAATTGKRHHLGVLFVHGIGNQTAGSTLTAFGTPIVEWLHARAARAGDTGAHVRVGATTLVGAGAEPATSELVLVSAHGERRWLLAEAWWAESFPMAEFRAVAEWSLVIVPWTIGTHFARRWTRARTEIGSGVAAATARIWAIAALVGALMLSPALLLILSLLLAIGRIPWPQLRSAVAAIQRAIGSSLGDSYMLVTRPLEAAAIRTRVRRDLAWMRLHCEKVAVVAHSQGGAIACQVLSTDHFDDSTGHLLVTFGSGLRKLEELDEERLRGGLLQGALLSVAGLLVAGVMLAAAPQALEQAYQGSASAMSLASLAVIGLGGLAVGIAGLQDFRHATEPTRLGTLACLLARRGVQWEDVYASADPVPNGAVRDDSKEPPHSTAVTNTRSLLHDHTAYWQNRDEFVPLVVEMLLAFDGAGVIGPNPTSVTSFYRAQRAIRIGLSLALRWATAACLLVLAVNFAREWLAVLAWLSHRTVAWAGGFVGYAPPAMATPDAGTWTRSVGWLVAVIAVSRVTRALWGSWHRRAMRDAEQGLLRVREPFGVAMALWAQLLLVGVIVPTSGLAFLIAGTTALGVLMVVTYLQRRHQVPTGADGPPEIPVSGPVRVWRALWSFAQAAVFVFIIGVLLPRGFLSAVMATYTVAASRFGEAMAWTLAGIMAAAGTVFAVAIVRAAWILERKK